MRRRELDLVAAGAEKCAGGLAQAGRNAFGVAGRQIEHVDLIEGVPRLALALTDEALAVGRPVALAGTLALDRESTDAGQEVALLIRRHGLKTMADAGTDRRDEQNGHKRSAEHSHREPLRRVAGVDYHRRTACAHLQNRQPIYDIE